jgi:enterochelin esterase-like enzyme
MVVLPRSLTLSFSALTALALIASSIACTSETCEETCSGVTPLPPGGGTGAGGSKPDGTGSGGGGSGSGGDTGGTAVVPGGSGGGMSLGGGGSVGGGGTGTSGGAAGTTAGGSAGSGGAFEIDNVGTEGDGDIMVGPTYTKDPNLTDLGKPKGKRFDFSLKAADSQIFKGTDATLTKPVTNADWSRGISVYVPKAYVDGTEAPFLVIQEGQLDNVSRALDNLTISDDAQKRLPAFIAIAVSNGAGRDGSDGKGSERGLEYDTMSDRYARFINTEVLPAVLANGPLKTAYPGLKLTANPDGRATMGCSSGGAAALSMGWFATESFHRIITYSGTFVAQQNEMQPEAQMFPTGAWEYHSEMKLIENAPKKPLRIFLHASENDNGKGRPEADHHDWVVANQRTAAALKAKGYHYRFVYSLATGHCDGKVFDLTLADTLSWVWRGYKAP